jgi:hypothetical protein
MQLVIDYKWRIRWAGRWTTTSIHFTAEDIVRNHPEAVCLVETKRERYFPSTDIEIAQAARANDNSHQGRPSPYTATDSCAPTTSQSPAKTAY